LLFFEASGANRLKKTNFFPARRTSRVVCYHNRTLTPATRSFARRHRRDRVSDPSSRLVAK
jgi:hypothetical protein